MSVVRVNAAQVEHWNGTEGRHWAAHHDRMEAMLGDLGARVLDAAAIQPGDAVLDVGCGTGSLTLAAAGRAGTAGRVVGLDLSAPMLERASLLAVESGTGNVAFVEGDAQTHPFDAAEFDVVVSRFGVMFFDDPTAAFTNIERALRSGGRVAFVCWQDAPFNEWMMVPSMAALAYVPPPNPAVFETLNPFAFAESDRVAEILTSAGLADVACHSVEQPLLFGGARTIEDAVEFFQHAGFGTALLSAATAEETDRALAAVAEVLADHLTVAGVQLGAAAWLVTATKP